MEIIDNEALTEKMGIVARQTGYDEETIRQKLIESNYDHMQVIKEYFGLDKKADQKTGVTKPSSVNQEIYKQIRKKMEIPDYNKKQEVKLQTEIANNQLGNNK